MTVYVDQMMACVPNRNWRYSENCHLFADSKPELLKFAGRMGLNPSWIQNTSLLHFDLTRNKRALALRLGAVEASPEKVVEHIRLRREERKAQETTPP